MNYIKIGVIYTGKKPGKDEHLFVEAGKKQNIDVSLINVSNKMTAKEIKNSIDDCDILYNSSAEEFVVEIVKTIEEMGKKIIEPSEIYYYTEDKWIFYLKCMEHKVPVPDTIILSENINSAKRELFEFGRWPVVLKRIYGTMGEYVEKADNIEQAEHFIKKFNKKGSEKLPIIAQEFICSPSYRVTIIGDRIVQTAIKTNKAGWKATGVYAKKFGTFKIDKNLKKIIRRLMKFVKISICGIDLLKKDGKWLALEVNSQPAYDFFENERARLIEQTVLYLKNRAKKRN